MSLSIFTSFSPDPARLDRQIHCVRSWCAIGAEVTAIQAAIEISDLAQAIPTTSINWIPAMVPAMVPLSLVWSYAETEPGFVLFLNSDIELRPFAGQIADSKIEQTIKDGCLCLVRENHDRGGLNAALEHHGFDGFYVRPRSLPNPFAGAPYCLGKPGWDYALPLAYLNAGKRLFGESRPIGRHLRHPEHWSRETWLEQMRYLFEPTGRAIRVRRGVYDDTKALKIRLHNALERLEI